MKCVDKAAKAAYDRARYLAHRPVKLAAAKAYRETHLVEIAAYREAYEPTHRAETNARARAYRKAHLAQVRGMQKAWREANKAKVAGYAHKWRQANPGKSNAKTLRRQAAKLQATPAWANEFFIEEIYDLAARRTKALGYEWHVDHVVPLRSKIVCGLHVENNLAVIPGADNVSKGNRFWPDMP